MRVALAGVVSSPSTRMYSHNAGYTFVTKSIVEKILGYEVTIETGLFDWDKYDAVILSEGVNYKENKFNFFGGVSDEQIRRMRDFNDYLGELYYFGPEKINYEDVAKKRMGIDVYPKRIVNLAEECPRKFTKLVLGDSHSLSVFQKGYSISKNDGKTLHGFLEDQISAHVPSYVRDIRFYAGNIDIRHHIRRIANTQYDAKKLIDKMLYALEEQFNVLLNRGILDSVELVQLLPIENPSRKIPKTGEYKNQPFYGTWQERTDAKNYFNDLLFDIACMNGFKFLEWGSEYLNDFGELSFDKMESKGSVHLAPHSYMFKNTFIS